MSLINCPECGKKISDKAISCPQCGCPSSEWKQNIKNESTIKEDLFPKITEEYIDSVYSEVDGKKILMIKKIREEIGCDLKTAQDEVKKYWDKKFPEKKLSYTPQRDLNERQSYIQEEKSKFNGIYKYTIFGKMEVYCPRCGSENCSHYQEQKIIPGKTKTKYTANINPLKPFTLFNKKEKVIKKDKVITEQKFICNSCGKIFL